METKLQIVIKKNLSSSHAQLSKLWADLAEKRVTAPLKFVL
jgi:hypothetical protein